MGNERSKAQLAAKICLGTSLTCLALVAVLVNAAFYSTLADYWPVARVVGPAVAVGAVLMAASFMLGLVLHGVVVVRGRRQAIPSAQVVHARPDARRAA